MSEILTQRAHDPYVAKTPWSPARPQTLVICCSDGRWHRQLVEFVQHEVSERADMYAVPGGAAVVDPWNSSFDEARVFEEAMRVFVEYHDLSSVWMIAHEGCAYYRLRHPQLVGEALAARQRDDLERAAVRLQERYPLLQMRRVYAAVHGAEVRFTTIEAAVPPGLSTGGSDAR